MPGEVSAGDRSRDMAVAMFETRLTTVGEWKWVTNPNDLYVGKSLEVYGEWSFGEIELMGRILRPRQNMVEIGSNIGAHTVFIARQVCPNGQVHAFEPRRLAFQMLCGNLALNGISNVRAHQLAVGREPGRLREGREPVETIFNFGGRALDTLAARDDSDEAIEVIRLDDRLDELKAITCLKADVEGWELAVLQGAAALIARDRPFLYLENDDAESSPMLLRHVMDLGYDVFWHIVPLFRKNNLARTQENIFGTVHSFNILCAPKEKRFQSSGLERVTDFFHHPAGGR
jgi:FkbM family methyltransferase